MKSGESFVDILRHRPVYAAVEPGEDVLLDRQVREDHPPLRHIAEAVRHALVTLFTGDFLPFERDRPAANLEYPDHRFGQCGLPHPVATHDGQGFALGQGETGIADDVAFSVVNIEVVDVKHKLFSVQDTRRSPVHNSEFNPSLLPRASYPNAGPLLFARSCGQKPCRARSPPDTGRGRFFSAAPPSARVHADSCPPLAHPEASAQGPASAACRSPATASAHGTMTRPWYRGRRADI